MALRNPVLPDDPSSNIRLVPQLVSVAKSIRQLVGIKLAEHDIAVGQDQFLLLFADDEALTVVDLANRLAVRPSTVSKMTDILERKGWTTRRADPHDGRRVLVQLTPDGVVARGCVQTVWEALDADLARALGTDATMVDALARIDAALVRRLNRLR